MLITYLYTRFLLRCFCHKENLNIYIYTCFFCEYSMKALRRERQMLSKQMQKRLSKQDRENLFLKWGIGLNAQHRRLQLVHRLWSHARDMNHIAESASVVAKLVGSVEPGKAFREMFGLNFTPRRSSRKSHRWKPKVKYLL